MLQIKSKSNAKCSFIRILHLIPPCFYCSPPIKTRLSPTGENWDVCLLISHEKISVNLSRSQRTPFFSFFFFFSCRHLGKKEHFCCLTSHLQSAGSVLLTQIENLKSRCRWSTSLDKENEPFNSCMDPQYAVCHAWGWLMLLSMLLHVSRLIQTRLNVCRAKRQTQDIQPWVRG